MHQQSRSDPERNNVREGVEFPPERGFPADGAGDAAVQQIEKAGEQDQRDGIDDDFNALRLHMAGIIGGIMQQEHHRKGAAEEIAGRHEVRPEVDFGQLVFHE